MAKYEEKFVVINRKHLEKLKRYDSMGSYAAHELEKAIDTFNRVFKGRICKELDQKYYVCNQDEPYAQEVIDIILKGESKKGR